MLFPNTYSLGILFIELSIVLFAMGLMLITITIDEWNMEGYETKTKKICCCFITGSISCISLMCSLFLFISGIQVII